MDNNMKLEIDQLVNKISNMTDLNIKVSVLNYMEQQAAYMLWQLEEEKRIDDDSHDF